MAPVLVMPRDRPQSVGVVSRLADEQVEVGGQQPLAGHRRRRAGARGDVRNPPADPPDASSAPGTLLAGRYVHLSVDERQGGGSVVDDAGAVQGKCLWSVGPRDGDGRVGQRVSSSARAPDSSGSWTKVELGIPSWVTERTAAHRRLAKVCSMQEGTAESGACQPAPHGGRPLAGRCPSDSPPPGRRRADQLPAGRCRPGRPRGAHAETHAPVSANRCSTAVYGARSSPCAATQSSS